MDYRAELFAQIDRVLAGAVSVASFEARFYDFYMDEVPETALSSSEHEYVSRICEKLDFTAESPDAASIRHGWVDHTQFLDWLRAHHVFFSGNA